MPRGSDHKKKKGGTRRIKGLGELFNLKLVKVEDLASDGGTAFPVALMAAFKKEKEAC